MKRFIFLTLCAASVALLGLSAGDSRADIKPGHLVAGAISWDGKYAVANIYVGGTYGQTVRGGRTAILEFWDGKGWYMLTSQRLPDIGPKGFYIAAPLGARKGSTTIRLRITPASFSPPSDVSQRTFPGLLTSSRDALITNTNRLDPFRAKTRPDLSPFKK